MLQVTKWTKWICLAAAMLLCSCGESGCQIAAEGDDGLASSSKIKPSSDDGLISGQTGPIEGKTIREALIDAYFELHHDAFLADHIEKETIEVADYFGCFNDVFVVSFNVIPKAGALTVEYSAYYEDVHYSFGTIDLAPRLFHNGVMYYFDKLESFGLSMADQRRLDLAIRKGAYLPLPGLDEIYDPEKAYGSHEKDVELDLDGYKVGGAIVRSYYAKRELEYRSLGIGIDDLRISSFYGKYGDYYCFRFNCLPYPMEKEGNYFFYGNTTIGYLEGEDIPWFWKKGRFVYWHQFLEPYSQGELTKTDMDAIVKAMKGEIEVSVDPLREIYHK